MLIEKVYSAERPDPVLKMANGECRMARNIEEHNDEENGKYLDYSEVFFMTDAEKQEIESDFEAYWNIGEEWGKTEEEILREKAEAYDILMGEQENE